ncbi:hypothetical protein Poly30_03840 [Planctomycetes bacterium Poly30]|uniref:HEAT repeat protein n=1 Tax=Saltatorellus ferox TaxID=2528018 RepID=A0A518ELC2_9BACT|nr:hypothetical protein Poly30_03840 [Planctomycetes bacterium Poly30]
MLVTTTALGLMMALPSTLSAGRTIQSQEVPPAAENAEKSAKASDDPFRDLRVEIAAARLELSELGAPQKALDRINTATKALLQLRPVAPGAVRYSAWIDVATELSTLHRKAVELGATEAPESKNDWIRLEMLARPSARPFTEPAAPRDIDQEIEQNAANGNLEFIAQIGERAVPGVLSALRKSSKDHYADITEDPLYMLMRIAPGAADRYVSEVLASGPPSLFWELRFARAVALARPFERLSGDSHMARYCDELLLKPDRVNWIAQAMLPFAERRSFTPGMRAKMREDIESGLQWNSDGPAIWLRVGQPQTQIRDLVLDALALPSSSNKEIAARTLLTMASNEGVYDASLRCSVDLRKEGVDWLKERTVFVTTTDLAGTHTSKVKWTPEYGEDESNFLCALLRDPDDRVRASVLRDLRSIERVASTVELAGWPEFGIAQESIKVERFPIEIGKDVLVELGRTAGPFEYEHLFRLGAGLEHDQVMSLIQGLRESDDEKAIDTAVALVRYLDWYGETSACVALASALFPSADGMSRLFHSAERRTRIETGLRHRQGLVALTKWALASEFPDLLHLIAHRNDPRPQLAALPPKLWARFAVTVEEYLPRGESVVRERTDSEARAAAVDLAAFDPDLSGTTRLTLLEGPAPGDLEVAQRAFLRLLQEKVWDASLNRDQGPLSQDISAALIRHYSLDFRRDLSGAIATDGAFGPERLGQIYLRISALPITPEIVEYAATHTDELRMKSSLVDAVVLWMRSNPSEARIEWIASLVGDPEFADSALEAIETLRDPALLPPVARLIKGPPTAPHYERAVRALESYLTDESAELLLTAARTTQSDETRIWCLQQLERIAALQDAENRWATRRVQQATREVTVSRLMGLLHDADQAVRIEAIRGLGTWEAVEAMPELIGLLKDTDPRIAAAARAALDRLNETR